MPETGTCQCCGEEKVLNDRALCSNCRTAQPCANHPDLLTMQRCAYCRKPSCAYCVEERLCPTCREEGRVAPERKERVKKAALSDEQKANRKRLIQLGGLLLVAGGFNYWYFVGGPPSSADVCVDRLNAAQTITMDYLVHHRNLPKSLTEVRLAAKAQKKTLPLMIPEGCRPIPGAVIYSFKGKQARFKTVTDTGELFKEDGQNVTEVTAP
jgi:hypothetical protein